ncbi:MAG TPA: hypothetical protein VKA83_09430 [Methylomirabilota bacterium]|nr:hypothetical protein [Methylomirabilota bacterium]
MPVISYEVTVTGPLFSNPDIARTFDREIAATLHDCGLVGVELVRQGTPRGVGAGGLGLRGATFTELRGVPGSRSQLISNPLPHVVPVELGRRPGAAMPPPGALVSWLVQKRSLSRDQAIRASFPLARAIGRRGIPGRFMFRQAFQRLRPYVTRQFEACAARISARLGGA